MKNWGKLGAPTRAILASSVSIATVAGFMMSAPALAQSAASQPLTEEQTAEVEDIVVTGTRVIRDGYTAPIPTTVLGAADIATRAPSNVADFVNILPSLASSVKPTTSIASVGPGTSGINALNLRNLGVNRTLVLLDGQRVGASTLTGWVDINQFPQALIKRVDVVTGGASADWGSDAVAGVVNFVLDRDFKGVKGDVQGGVTTYGDDRNYKASLTAGASFADDRGHILLSGEIAHNDGVRGIGDRKWYKAKKIFFNPAYTATNGQPQLLVRENTGFATVTPGGIITSGPLRGTYFGQGGTPTQFNYGSIVSGNFMQGGDSQYSDFGTTGDLSPRLSRQNAFGRLSFDVTDNVQIFGQLSYGRAHSRVAFSDQFVFGSSTVAAGATSTVSTIVIQPDNAFIPASIRSRVTGPFSLGTTNEDLGPIILTTNRKSVRGMIGASGDFDAVGSNWKWDAYAQRSVSRVYTAARTTITARYNQAIDAVVNPATGAIVCRSTLTNPTNGCVPYNIFGTGVVSDAARNYVLGTAFGRTRLTQNVQALTMRGDPFSTWAGPVSVAFGVEHRKEAVSGSSDALSPARSYFAGNYNASFGSYNVTEGFLEAVIPLAKDASFAKSLDLNAAVRATDYSTSGYVTTWKAGLTYKPIDDITLRVTRSRDIRAPNLSELFQFNQTAGANVTDPSRGNAATTVFSVTSGNPNLKPEKADTFGAGLVVQPSFLPGFAASVDYYNIDIKGAISTVVAQTLVNQCFAGNTPLCAQIQRNAAGVITTVLVQPINLSKQLSRGVDFEASYRRDLANLSSGLSGNLTLRVLATRFIKNYFNNGINRPTDTVGTNSQNGTAAGVSPSLPRWRYLASVGWDGEAAAVQLTARGFSSGKLNTAYIECTTGCPTSTTEQMTIENNRVPGAIYFDAYGSYKLFGDAEVFVAVDNFTNKSPAQVAYGPSIGGTPISVNPALFDVLGRTFRAGFRFKI
ncbi:TonB-dependent receptor plug domain-containing protein [Sphingomonas crocodyli]|uniref:TonB-dependent receptor n=1 Tax=Sphingomonas crocodyli TaxID=1979270 RepID=A0A437M700_9SPHN|nr:TonB-dependent receptor [Sphingomonas crocodyli]RVT93490.1 TonB-dependent receptor [Sphingomonas crocodyli]